MSIAAYNWSSDKPSDEKIRICISDRLNVLPPHSQEETELMYFYKTQGCRYLVDGRVLVMETDELVIANPGETHGCTDWGKNCRAVCLIVNINGLGIESLKDISFVNKVSDCKELKEIFSHLEEILTDNTLPATQTDCYVHSLLLRLLGFLAGNYRIERKRKKASEIDKIASYIQNNLTERLTVEALARIMNLSTDRFYHIFKEKMGISPIRYITEKRILAACTMLKNTDFSIAQIAQDCGFCTASYFSEQFFKLMKITPTDYRKQKGSDDLH